MVRLLKTVVVKPTMAVGDIAPICAALSTPDCVAVNSSTVEDEVDARKLGG